MSYALEQQNIGGRVYALDLDLTLTSSSGTDCMTSAITSLSFHFLMSTLQVYWKITSRVTGIEQALKHTQEPLLLLLLLSNSTYKAGGLCTLQWKWWQSWSYSGAFIPQYPAGYKLGSLFSPSPSPFLHPVPIRDKEVDLICITD